MSARSTAELAARSSIDRTPGRPLHDLHLDPDEWWACAQPERPADSGVWWDEECPRCLIAYEAARRAGGTVVLVEGVWRDLDDYDPFPLLS